MHRWLIIALATTVPAATAFGATFHVDARAAPPSGVHRRISDAVAAAGPGDTIVVAPGVYAHEDVPITIGPDKAGLTITGSTVFLRDAEGLPVAPVEATAAVVTGARSGLGYGSLMYVTADDVTIRGLVIDGQTWMAGIVIDGNSAPGRAIARFAVTGNGFRFCDICLFTRGASGTIEDNLIGKVSDARRALNNFVGFGGHFGAIVAGGRVADGTEVSVLRNRVSGNNFAGVYGIGDRATAFPPAEDAGLHEDGALKIVVAQNDFTRNGMAALHFVAHGNVFNSHPDRESHVVAEVRDNTFDHNFHHGLAIHVPVGSFNAAICAAAAPGEVHATLEGNTWEGNEANDALFGFAAYRLSISGELRCYVRDHVTIVEGEVPGFDTDSPVCDPLQTGCVPLGNTLLVNGVEATGISITPR